MKTERTGRDGGFWRELRQALTAIRDSVCPESVPPLQAMPPAPSSGSYGLGQIPAEHQHPRHPGGVTWEPVYTADSAKPAMWVAGGVIRTPEDLRPPCPHDRTEPVDLLVTGERVAELCLDCDTRLPPEQACPRCGAGCRAQVSELLNDVVWACTRCDWREGN